MWTWKLVSGSRQVLSFWRHCRTWRVLNVCDTRLDATAFIAKRQRVLQWRRGCRVGRYNNEQTPLWQAADNGQVETAQRLLLGGGGGVRGVEVDRAWKNDGCTPLIQAATQGFAEVARVLIQHGAVVNKSRNDGTTPLFMAAAQGFVEMTELLIKNRADINQSDDNSVTPNQQGCLQGPRRCRPGLVGDGRRPHHQR